MSVRQYDEEPFPYQVEHYRDLERGQWVEVRANDVALPVGARGVVLKRVAESGNYQVAVEIEGQAEKRVVALCPDQVRPIEPPLPAEPEAAAAEAPKAKQASGWTEEKRAEQAERVREMWARKKAERAAAAAEPAPEKPKRKLSAKPAPKPKPELDPNLMTRHRPEGMDNRIAAAVGTPEPAIVEEISDAIRQLQDYREPTPVSRGKELRDRVRGFAPEPKPEPLTWTRRAADAIRPVLAEAAAAGGEVTQLALLVETISYLEDGGRP